MSNDITSYLLLPEQARWAKENGFCARTSHFYNAEMMLFISTSRDGFVSGGMTGNIAIPTFNAFFDWVEEKWGIEVKPDFISSSGEKMYQYRIVKDGWNLTPTEYRDYFDTKREARICITNAIIKHIDNLKK